MSQESVEVVRRVTDVMDAEGFEAALPIFLKAAHPDVEWRMGKEKSPGPTACVSLVCVSGRRARGATCGVSTRRRGDTRR